MEPRLTISTLSEKSSLSEYTIIREIKRGNLRATKVCGRWLVKESHANLWLSYSSERTGASGRTSGARAVAASASANANDTTRVVSVLEGAN